MNPIKILSDSTCDLSRELLEQHQIGIIPLYVNFGEESYLDGVTLRVPEMYEKVREKGVLPKTAAVSPADFEAVFHRTLEEGYDILFLGIGSKFSATFQNANLAKNTLGSDRIRLVDSQNLSSGTGLLVLKACKFRDEGDDLETIAKKIEALVPKVRTQFVINTMEYLYKGGRCSSIVALVGTLLKIKPIIKVVDGAMTVGKKAHGKITAGLDLLIDEVQGLASRLDGDFLTVTHSLAEDSARYIRERIADLPVKGIYETPAGCVISSHCGEGCIGILYLLK